MNAIKIKRAWPFFLMCFLITLYLLLLLQLVFKQVFPFWLIIPIAIVLFAGLICLSRFSRDHGFQIVESPDRFQFPIFFLLFLIPAATRLVFFLAYFPGGASSDTLIQWQQLRIGQFDDWHPALHTIYEWAITRIIYHPAALLILQDLSFSLSVAYVGTVLWRWHVPKLITIGTICYLSFSPSTGNLLTFIWKDCSFAIFALLLCSQLLAIIFSNGTWLEHKANILALAVVLSLCSILRHNGIAATLPVIVWLLISLAGHRRAMLISTVLCFILYVGIRGPLYQAFHVTPAERRLEETYGVPITILSHIYAVSPDSLDEETQQFLEIIAPQSVYAEFDSVGDWNETKWHVSPGDLSAYTLSQVFGFALRAFASEPALAIEALSELWRMPLLPFGDSYWRMSPYIESADYASYTGFNFTMQGNPVLKYLLNGICRHTAKLWISWLFWNPGFPLLIVMLACAAFARYRRLVALTIPALIIGYTFATSLVLSSPTDFRFFLCVPLCAPLAVIGLFAKCPKPSHLFSEQHQKSLSDG